MITSFEVGSIFKIVDEATPTLFKISEKLSAFSDKLRAIEKRLGSFGNLKVAPGLSEGLATIGKQFEKLGGQSEATTTSISANFGKADLSIDSTVKAVGKLTTALGEAKAAAAGIGRIAGPSSGASSGGHGSHGSRRGGHGSRGVAHVGYGGLDVAIGSFIAADGIYHGEKSAIEKAAELAHAQQQMRMAGFKPDEIEASKKAAWDVSGRLGLSVVDVMNDIKELRQPFGGVGEVMQFLDPLEKMRVVLNAVTEGKGNEAHDAVYQMARAGELKGLNDPKDYLKYFDDMTKVISATGGKVGPREFMQATKYARLSALGFNEEYYTKYLPTLIQGLGASGAGTANAALFGTLVQGKASEGSGAAMEKLGLIGDKSKIRHTKMGIHLDPGAVVDSDLLMANPLKWVEKDLLPRMEKKYGDLSQDKNRLKAIEDMGQIFGNRMSAQAAGEFLLRMKSFDRDMKMNTGGVGTAGAEGLVKNDPSTAMTRLSNAWTNLLTSFGGPLVDPAVKAMNLLSDGLKKLTELSNAHPEAMKQIGVACAGLAGGLALLAAGTVIAGAVALAPGAAVGVAIAAIAGVITSLAALNWKAVADGFQSLWDKVKNFLGSGSGDAGPSGVPVPNPMKPPSLLYAPHGFGKMSYDGSGLGGGLINAAYVTGANDNGTSTIAAASGLPGIVNQSGGVINIMAGGGDGAGGSGGGLIRASYGGVGGGGFSGHLGGAGGDWAGGGRGSNQAFSSAGIESVRQYIRSKAAALGIDPNIAERVARSEGLNSSLGAGGDHGTSDGPYQLHIGGGIGDLYQRLYHRSIHDKSPQALKDQIDFALGFAAKNGWGSWYGARNSHIGKWQGIGGTPHPSVAAVPPPPKKPRETVIHNHMHVDGKVMARSVTRHQEYAGMFPTAVGGIDAHGSFASPGTPLLDAA